MGECYSCQSRSAKQHYHNSDMSLSSNQTPYSGVRRYSGPPTSRQRKAPSPSRIRNSNEQLVNEEERAALATITNGPSNLAASDNKSKSQPSVTHVGGSRFGFRLGPSKNRNNPDSNSNITATGVTSSSDSLDSYGPNRFKAPTRPSGLIGKQYPAQRPTCMSIGDAFAPPQMARWRMIDDSDTGTLTSMSLSPSTPSDAVLKLLTGDSQRTLDTNGNMNTDSSSNINESSGGVGYKQSKPHSERKPYSRIPNVGTSRVPSKLQRPSAGSAVTTSSTSSNSAPEPQGQNAENNKSKSQTKPRSRKFVGGWFGKKSSSQEVKSSQVQKEKSQPQKESKNKSNLSKSNVQPKQQLQLSVVKPDDRHLDTNLNESEGSGEAMAEPEKDAVFEDVTDGKTADTGKREIVIETEIISGPASHIPDVESKDLDVEKKTARQGTVPSEPSGRGGHVPLARQDSVDSGSMCSLNSDDLMMDFDDPADQSLDRSALSLKFNRKTSTERRGKLLSTEDASTTEESERDQKSHPAVDKAVHAAVATQMQAAVPYTPSTSSVPSSPDALSSCASGGRDSVPISPLSLDAAPVSKGPQKPQSLSLRNPLSSARGPGAGAQGTCVAGSFTSPVVAESGGGAVQAVSSQPRPAHPLQRRSVDSPRGLRARVNSATEAIDELSSLTSQLSLHSPLNESHPVQR